jgi:hypothetical protein
MASLEEASRLKSLPPEIFNRILGYVLDPIQSKVCSSPPKFRAYRFDTAILRVNKAIHTVAKTDLHYSISWLRFDVNWDAFLIDPYWLGIPYIAIDRQDTPKTLPYPYGGDSQRRSLKQQAPPGRVSVRVKFQFPPAQSRLQKIARARCFDPQFGILASLLVLDSDFDKFIRVVRLNDLAYCRRVLPTTNTSNKVLATRSDEGIVFDVQIRPGQQLQQYEHIVDCLVPLSGPFHEVTITGYRDDDFVVALASTIGLRRPGQERREQIIHHKSQTHLEGIGSIMSLNFLGDRHL